MQLAAAICTTAFTAIAAPRHNPDAAPPGAPASESAGDALRLNIYSWGRPERSWSIAPDGSGYFERTRSRGGFNDYEIVRKAFTASPGRYEELMRLLRPVIGSYGGGALPCGVAMTDAPYGEVHWRHDGATRSVSFNLGCDPSGAGDAYGRIGQADTLVQGWSAHLPVADVSGQAQRPPGH